MERATWKAWNPKIGIKWDIISWKGDGHAEVQRHGFYHRYSRVSARRSILIHTDRVFIFWEGGDEDWRGSGQAGDFPLVFPQRRCALSGCNQATKALFVPVITKWWVTPLRPPAHGTGDGWWWWWGWRGGGGRRGKGAREADWNVPREDREHQKRGKKGEGENKKGVWSNDCWSLSQVCHRRI